jgi:plastocyanin
MKKFALVLSVLALAMFGLAACGDEDDDQSASEDVTPTTVETETTADDSGGGGEALAVSAVPDEIAYEESELSAAAGPVTIEFDNPGSIPHDVVIEDADGNEVARTDVISDDTTTADGELEAGEYTFYCSVDGHRDQGMEGPLTVE